MLAPLLASVVLNCLVAGPAVGADWLPMRFDHLDLEQGLSQSTVTCILKDSRGFLWVGTEDGLNRYDGYGFTVFKPQPGRPRSLSSAQVWSLCESRDGSLWVGTYGGLNRFDRMTETFSAFRHDPADPGTLSSDLVRSVVEDPPWCGVGRHQERAQQARAGPRGSPGDEVPARPGGPRVDRRLVR
ncbi:MAG: two-component regulator propeller domain-containing protein [Thermoanaerobaculaceae bacterium]